MFVYNYHCLSPLINYGIDYSSNYYWEKEDVCVMTGKGGGKSFVLSFASVD